MKRSLKDFLLTLVLSVIIFAVVAFFLIRAAESLMGDVVGSVRSAGDRSGEVPVIHETEDLPLTLENGEVVARRTFSMLFMVLDDENRADAIFLLGINAEKKSATLALIPANTGVTEVGVTYRLGDLYAARSAAAMARFMKDQVGLTPQYYMALTRDGFSNWIDFLGGVRFSVPRDMEGFSAAANRKISLKAGDQVLSGEQAASFLAFDGFGSEAARDEAVLSFAKAFCAQVLQTPNLSAARSIYYNVAHHMNTDFTEQDLVTHGAVLFRFNEFSPTCIRIPGATGANGYYSISTGRVQPMFEWYQ